MQQTHERYVTPVNHSSDKNLSLPSRYASLPFSSTSPYVAK
jgi:hypothetical protein